MALDGTYAGLQASIASMLDVSSTTFTNQIADIVVLGESRIFREAKTRDNEAVLSGTISAGVISVPADFVAPKFAYLTTSPSTKLDWRSAEWVYSEYPYRTSSGKPKFYAREGANFIFGPYPDSGYAVGGIYYNKPGTLSSAVYDLFTNNQDLYLFACLAQADKILGRDARTPMWEAEYTRILNDANAQGRGSVGDMQMRPV